MNENEIKQLWQTQALPAPAPVDDLSGRMKQKMRRFNRDIFWRDIREVAACAVIILWFGADLRHDHSTLRWTGDVILVLSGGYIAAKLLRARRSQRSFLNPDSVREFLAGELDKVERQIRLLRTVFWWYLLPLLCGVCLFFVGTNSDLLTDAIVLPVFFLTYWFIYWINQYAVKKTLLPLKTELEQMLKSVTDLTESESFPDQESSTL
jgi:hypothetical protein